MKTFLALILAFCVTVKANEWSYAGRTGPANWKGECKNLAQSPIDIPREGAKSRTENPFVFVNYDRTPQEAHIENTGYTVKYAVDIMNKEEEPLVYGGGLEDRFAFAQMHWHWGSSDEKGSEHTIGHVSYPMELHLVHYNTRYGADIGNSIAMGTQKKAKDILAVLGIMFQLSNKDNENLEPITEVLGSVNGVHTHAKTDLFPLKDVLPEDTTKFYRYNGSLTTPGCNEIVIWTVFKDPIPISSRQLSNFRSLYNTVPTMSDNFRPTMPLNGRQVWDVETSKDSGADTTKAFTIFTSIVCFVTVRAFA